jgi:hypothetical protein
VEEEEEEEEEKKKKKKKKKKKWSIMGKTGFTSLCTKSALSVAAQYEKE